MKDCTLFNKYSRFQCWGSGSGSVCFWDSRIRILIRKSQVRIRLQILPSPSKSSKQNVNFYCFVTSSWLFIFEEWFKCTSVLNPDPDLYDPYVLGLPDPLGRGTDPRIRIRSLIRTTMSRIPYTVRLECKTDIRHNFKTLKIITVLFLSERRHCPPYRLGDGSPQADPHPPGDRHQRRSPQQAGRDGARHCAQKEPHRNSGHTAGRSAAETSRSASGQTSWSASGQTCRRHWWGLTEGSVQYSRAAQSQWLWSDRVDGHWGRQGLPAAAPFNGGSGDAVSARENSE